MSFTITTAERQAAPVSVYIEGESGSGKTYSALLLARGLAGPGEKIGIIDTEGGRSLIYADDETIGGYEYMHFEAPYSPDRFIEALKAAVADGWKAVVIDSASLEHDGEGGLLDSAEQEYERILAKNPNNRAANQQKWTKPKLEHRRFLTFSTGLPCHIIMCFRQVLTTDFNAKPNPVTIKSPVVEKNTKFFLELHAEIDADHNAHWTRIPKPYLGCIENDKPISVQTGRRLAQENESGQGGAKPADAGKAAEKPAEAQPDTLDEDIATMIASEGIDEAWFNKAIAYKYKGKYKDWREVPVKHKEVYATDEGFQKIKAEVEKIMKQEGAA